MHSLCTLSHDELTDWPFGRTESEQEIRAGSPVNFRHISKSQNRFNLILSTVEYVTRKVFCSSFKEKHLAGVQLFQASKVFFMSILLSFLSYLLHVGTFQ